MILSDQPQERMTKVRWTKDLCRTHLKSALKGCRNGFYGAVWSRHAVLRSGHELEMSFGSRTWACLSPMDPGTRYVVQDAFRILYDPQGVLKALNASTAAQPLAQADPLRHAA
jgi:hypothetical protein